MIKDSAVCPIIPSIRVLITFGCLSLISQNGMLKFDVLSDVILGKPVNKQ